MFIAHYALLLPGIESLGRGWLLVRGVGADTALDLEFWRVEGRGVVTALGRGSPGGLLVLCIDVVGCCGRGL
jgi:hypothetical protein